MAVYFLKRFGQSLITLLAIVTLVFCLLRLMPENGYLGEDAHKLSESVREARLRSMGLRDPLLVQIKDFYFKLLNGDLGKSLIIEKNVAISEILGRKAPYSIVFGLVSIGFSLLVGIPAGAVMARNKGRVFDKAGTLLIVIINSVPSIVYQMLIQLYITGWLGLDTIFYAEKPQTWILPVISLSLSGMAFYAMWMRRYMVDEINKDYVKLARAKGQSSKKIMLRHVFRNSFVPLVQYIPSSILFTIAGSIVVESLYSIPGMGGLVVSAIKQQDNPLVQALVVVYSCMGVFGLMLGDAAMAVVDPRIRFTKTEGAR